VRDDLLRSVRIRSMIATVARVSSAELGRWTEFGLDAYAVLNHGFRLHSTRARPAHLAAAEKMQHAVRQGYRASTFIWFSAR
jgi:hypothetical protein